MSEDAPVMPERDPKERAKDFGMEAQRELSETDKIIIRTVQKRKWYEVILRALPQDIECPANKGAEGEHPGRHYQKRRSTAFLKNADEIFLHDYYPQSQ